MPSSMFTRISAFLIGLAFLGSVLGAEAKKSPSPQKAPSDPSVAAASAPFAAPQEETPARAVFDLVKEVDPAAIVLAKTEHAGVLAAAKDLQRDVTKITGVTPNIVHSLNDTWGKCVVIGSADCPEGKALLAAVGVPTEDLDGKWESFKVRVLNHAGGKEQVLAIAGSNVRGTIFGVYDFEEKHLGVDPLWFWADHEPATRGELVFDDRINFGPTKEPTWKYRGWTLNDHPQFMEWLESGIVQRTRYSRYMFAIHPQVLERLWEAALRLKMNMFTWYFIDIDWYPDYERLRAAVDRGLFVTQHQMESVGADTGFWDDYWRNHNPAGKPKEFSYRLHPEAFQEFWTYYIRRWSEFSPQVVWELNLRGWADGEYQEPTLPDGGTPQERSAIISQAIADQAKLVRKIDPNPDVEMMTSLYNELGRAYDQGWIKIPEGVTTGFCDAGMSGMSYSKKAFWTEPRDPKRRFGQYFHTQYFGGGPQIAKCTPVEQYLQVNIDAMYQRGDTQHMLLAMNELRHQQIEIRGIAEMLWDYPGFQPRQYLLRYCREQFGEKAAQKVLALYDEYYEKYPHKMVHDGFKKYPSYYKVMEPLFTTIANLQNIDTGNRDGFAVAYQYDKKIYEQGIHDLGEVLEHALALRSEIPEDRRYFYDYEFPDAIRQVRGIYRLTIAAHDAIARLAEGDRKAALAALLDARPLVEEMYAAFQHTAAGEKWQYWYRSGTNEDIYLAYNLYQKARLRLEVEPMSFVTQIEPQRHPYLGNVVTHQPAQAGDAVYSSQCERLNSSMYNGAPFSILSFPLEDAFQIGGIQSVYHKWKLPVADFGLSYRFTLQGPATVYVAKLAGQSLEWLKKQGFRDTEKSMEVGQWSWPYRYRNRPPQTTHLFQLFAKDFPAGQVTLGENPPQKDRFPYIVFVQPRLLLFENFHGGAVGQSPEGWQIAPGSGRVEIVANPDYEGEMRPTVFDLATVPRYRPLGLKSLRLSTASGSGDPPAAVLPFRCGTREDFVVDVRLKPGQTTCRTGFALVTEDGVSAVAVALTDAGRITWAGPGEKAVDVAPYEAGRWYNLKLEISPALGKCRLTVQNDRIEETSRDDLPFAQSAKEPFRAIHLAHGDGNAEGWIVYDAIAAHIR